MRVFCKKITKKIKKAEKCLLLSRNAKVIKNKSALLLQLEMLCREKATEVVCLRSLKRIVWPWHAQPHCQTLEPHHSHGYRTMGWIISDTRLIDVNIFIDYGQRIVCLGSAYFLILYSSPQRYHN